VTSTGTCTTSSTTVPDLAGGVYTPTASDGTNTATDASTFTQAVRADYTGTSDTLTDNTDVTGATTIVRTGAAFGVHGLAANTAYTITFDAAAGSTQVGSFTSTSSGGIPAPGVQFTVPADSSGVHIVTFWAGTTDAFFGVATTDTGVAGSDATTSSTLNAYTGQYMNLLFNMNPTLTASPTVGGYGTVVSLAGSGLKASTTYDVSFSSTSGSPGTSVALLGTLTTSASGVLSASSGTLTVPAAPTLSSSGNTENATSFYFHVASASQFLGGTQTGQALFIDHPTATLANATLAPDATVTVNAQGLLASTVYNIIFNKQTVGAVVSNSQGTGSGSFTVPAGTTAGSYSVKLQNPSTYSTAKMALTNPPTLTVSVGGATGTLGTGTLTTSANPTEAPVSG